MRFSFRRDSSSNM